MTTYDNGPPLEGWRPEPRQAPVFDLVTRIKAAALAPLVPLAMQALDGLGDN